MKNIKSMRLRRFIAKYIQYLEVAAYCLVVVVGGGVAAAWLWKVEVTAGSIAGDLKPYEHSIACDAKCVVVALPCEDKTDVQEGQVVVEVCKDPEWVAEAEVMSQIRSVLDAMREEPDEEPEAAEDEGEGEAGEPVEEPDEEPVEDEEPAPILPRFLPVAQGLEAQLRAWESKTPPATEKLVAPAAGLIWLGSCEVGKIYDADAKILGVKDFAQLRAKLSFEAKNVEFCRPGLKGKLDIRTEQSFETLMRLNSDSLPAVPYFGARLDQFSRLASTEIRDLVTDSVVGEEYLDKEKAVAGDFPLPAKSVDNITIRVSGVRESQAGADAELVGENFRVEKLPAVVVSGTHTSGITLLELDEEAQAKVRQKVEESLAAAAIAEDEGAFTLPKGIDEVVVNLQVNTEQPCDDWDLETYPEGRDPEEFEEDEGEREEHEGSKTVKRKNRKFSGTLQLIAPEQSLQDLARVLAIDGKSLKVTGEIVTGRTRFAMLLFRKH